MNKEDWLRMVMECLVNSLCVVKPYLLRENPTPLCVVTATTFILFFQLMDMNRFGCDKNNQQGVTMTERKVIKVSDVIRVDLTRQDVTDDQWEKMAEEDMEMSMYERKDMINV
jgi:thiamine biosynthesis lipoprotein ApbE